VRTWQLLLDKYLSTDVNTYRAHTSGLPSILVQSRTTTAEPDETTLRAPSPNTLAAAEPTHTLGVPNISESVVSAPTRSSIQAKSSAVWAPSSPVASPTGSENTGHLGVFET
jgi:hypothetical protein